MKTKKILLRMRAGHWVWSFLKGERAFLSNLNIFTKVKYEVWLLSQRCFKAAMKTKLSYMIQANSCVLLYRDTIGVPVREINNNRNRVKSERQSNKRIQKNPLHKRELKWWKSKLSCLIKIIEKTTESVQ